MGEKCMKCEYLYFDKKYRGWFCIFNKCKNNKLNTKIY